MWHTVCVEKVAPCVFEKVVLYMYGREHTCTRACSSEAPNVGLVRTIYVYRVHIRYVVQVINKYVVIRLIHTILANPNHMLLLDLWGLLLAFTQSVRPASMLSLNLWGLLPCFHSICEACFHAFTQSLRPASMLSLNLWGLLLCFHSICEACFYAFTQSLRPASMLSLNLWGLLLCFHSIFEACFYAFTQSVRPASMLSLNLWGLLLCFHSICEACFYAYRLLAFGYTASMLTRLYACTLLCLHGYNWLLAFGLIVGYNYYFIANRPGNNASKIDCVIGSCNISPSYLYHHRHIKHSQKGKIQYAFLFVSSQTYIKHSRKGKDPICLPLSGTRKMTVPYNSEWKGLISSS